MTYRELVKLILDNPENLTNEVIMYNDVKDKYHPVVGSQLTISNVELDIGYLLLNIDD